MRKGYACHALVGEGRGALAPLASFLRSLLVRVVPILGEGERRARVRSAEGDGGIGCGEGGRTDRIDGVRQRLDVSDEALFQVRPSDCCQVGGVDLGQRGLAALGQARL